jgi:pimeloyl-ACP methyl ester carboxylesterase
LKIKRLFAAASVALPLAVTATFVRTYLRWKRDALARLSTHSQVIETAMGPVEYAMEGDGPAVLVLHGTPGGYDQGIAIGHALLGAGYSIVSVSRPGYLRTPLIHRSSQEQADLCAALLDALKISHVGVIGVSGGGPCALQFALRHGNYCDSLVLLCAVAHRFKITNRLFQKECYDVLPPWSRFTRTVFSQLLTFNNPFLFVWEIAMSRKHDETMNEFNRSSEMHQLRLDGFVNDSVEFETMADHFWERIEVPTLVVQGSRDGDLSLSHAEWAARKIPGAEFVIDEGGSHFFFIEHKERIAKLVQGFLDTQRETCNTLQYQALEDDVDEQDAITERLLALNGIRRHSSE